MGTGGVRAETTDGDDFVTFFRELASEIREELAGGGGIGVEDWLRRSMRMARVLAPSFYCDCMFKSFGVFYAHEHGVLTVAKGALADFREPTFGKGCADGWSIPHP